MNNNEFNFKSAIGCKFVNQVISYLDSRNNFKMLKIIIFQYF